MSRLFIIIIIPLASLLFFSCVDQKSESANINEELYELHGLKSRKIPTDSIYQNFLKFLPQVENSPSVADSSKTWHYYLMGLYNRNNSSHDSAIFYLERATLSLDKNMHNNFKRRMYGVLWQIHLNRREYGNCLAVSEDFKKYLVNEEDLGMYAEYYRWNAQVYQETKELEEAEKFSLKRIDALNRIGNTKNIVDALVQRANIKFNQGDKKLAYRIYDSIPNMKIYKEASPVYLRRVNSDIAVTLFKDKQFDKSLIFFKRSIVFGKKAKIFKARKRNLLINLYTNTSENCLELGMIEKAGLYLDSAYNVGLEGIAFKQIKNYWNNRLRYDQLLNKGKSNNGYLDSLFLYHEKEIKKQSADQLLSFQKANDAKKELQATQVERDLAAARQQVRLIVGITILIVLSLLGLYFYKRRKDQHEKHGLQMQQRLLRAQMNPHFTFNILYSIQNLVKKDPLKASEYLIVFSRLLRLILENSMSDYVLIEKEIDSLKKFLDLQLIRFPHKFKYRFIYNDLSEDDMIYIPPMLIQPIIENSIEHGFKGIDYEGEIVLTLTHYDDYFIECKIEDNGRGLKQDDVLDKKSASTKLIKDYLERSTKKKMNISDRKKSSIDESGVEVSFLLPYKLSEND